MSKLKTLNELDESGKNTESFSHHTHLKQETIKWVKEANDQSHIPLTHADWLVFFNITEEDCK